MYCNFCKTKIPDLEKCHVYHMDFYSAVICDRCNDKFQHELIKLIEEFWEELDKEKENHDQ